MSENILKPWMVAPEKIQPVKPEEVTMIALAFRGLVRNTHDAADRRGLVATTVDDTVSSNTVALDGEDPGDRIEVAETTPRSDLPRMYEPDFTITIIGRAATHEYTNNNMVGPVYRRDIPFTVPRSNKDFDDELVTLVSSRGRQTAAHTLSSAVQVGKQEVQVLEKYVMHGTYAYSRHA